MELLLKLSETLMAYGHLAYLAIFLILLACGFGLPLPEDVVLVTGGILVAAGVCDFEVMLAVTFGGVLIGDGIIFHLGRHYGPRITSRWPFKLFLNEQRMEKTREVFKKYGEKVVLAARFMPGLRMPIFLTAGSFGVPPWKFWVFDGLAALLSVPAWVWVGHFFAGHLEELERVMRQTQMVILSIIAALIIGVIWFFYKKKKTQTLTDK
jgi:membrane protein DedA with SNARE-associated domain